MNFNYILIAAITTLAAHAQPAPKKSSNVTETLEHFLPSNLLQEIGLDAAVENRTQPSRQAPTLSNVTETLEHFLSSDLLVEISLEAAAENRTQPPRQAPTLNLERLFYGATLAPDVRQNSRGQLINLIIDPVQEDILKRQVLNRIFDTIRNDLNPESRSDWIARLQEVVPYLNSDPELQSLINNFLYPQRQPVARPQIVSGYNPRYNGQDFLVQIQRYFLALSGSSATASSRGSLSTLIEMAQNQNVRLDYRQHAFVAVLIIAAERQNDVSLEDPQSQLNLQSFLTTTPDLAHSLFPRRRVDILRTITTQLGLAQNQQLTDRILPALRSFRMCLLNTEGGYLVPLYDSLITALTTFLPTAARPVMITSGSF